MNIEIVCNDFYDYEVIYGLLEFGTGSASGGIFKQDGFDKDPKTMSMSVQLILHNGANWYHSSPVRHFHLSSKDWMQVTATTFINTYYKMMGTPI